MAYCKRRGRKEEEERRSQSKGQCRRKVKEGRRTHDDGIDSSLDPLIMSQGDGLGLNSPGRLGEILDGVGLREKRVEQNQRRVGVKASFGRMERT